MSAGITVHEGDEATGEFEAASERIVLGSATVDLAARLRDERLRLGYSQTEFAEFGGVRKRAQINYEQGKRTPDAGYLLGIAKLGADVRYIITGQQSELLEADVAIAAEAAALIDGSEPTYNGTPAPATNEPGERLWNEVRAGFILQGTTLSRWCRAHRIASTWAGHALKGRRNGPAARRLVMRLIRAAGLVCRS